MAATGWRASWRGRVITVEREAMQGMVLSVLAVVGAVVAAAELVLLHQQRRSFLGPDRPRRRFFKRRQFPAARQLYLRWRRNLSALWVTARTAPFPAEAVSGVGAGQVAGAPAGARAGQPAPVSTAANSPPPNGGRTLKRHAARNVLHWISIADDAELQSYRSFVEAAEAVRAGALSPAQPLVAPARTDTAWGADAPSTATVPPTPAGEGIVYVDGSGHVTFANAAARNLLHWHSGDRALSDVLAGGTQESDALLEAVARHELIEREVTLLSGTSPTRLEISALALRDRDGSLWGAALFIRRSPAARQPSTVTGD
jgi:PAS domain-containing protein